MDYHGGTILEEVSKICYNDTKHFIHVTYLAYRFLVGGGGGIHKISYSKLFSCVCIYDEKENEASLYSK